MPDPDLARFPPHMWDKSWTYVDCYDRYYRYKNTHSPYTCYGEHNQIKIGGWSVETWDLTYKWIKYENLATEEEINDLINTLKRNAERRRKLYE